MKIEYTICKRCNELVESENVIEGMCDDCLAEYKHEVKERRERMATALMAGLIDGDVTLQGLKYAAQTALLGAEILMKEIDGPIASIEALDEVKE